MIQFAVLVLAAYVFGRRIFRALLGEQEKPQPTQTRSASPGAVDPYEVLGVKLDASDEEVRRAYQEQIRKYHPDYLENMAPELRSIAEQRTKEINRAYESLKQRGRGSATRPRD